MRLILLSNLPIRDIKFIETLKQKLLKIEMTSEMEEQMTRMITNIHRYLNQEQDIGGTQALVGYKYLFRGVIVSDWFGSNESEIRYVDLNTVIIHACVNYYMTL